MRLIDRKTAEYQAKLAQDESNKQADWKQIKTRMPNIARALEMSAKVFGKVTLIKFEINQGQR